MTKRILFYILGLLTMALGTVLLLQAGLGLSAFDALCAGMSQITFLSTGKWCMIFGIAIIFINAFIQKCIPSVLSFLTSIIVGGCIDFWFLILSINASSILFKIIIFAVGMIINAFGVSLYISADLVKGPIDQLMVNISTLLRKNLWVGKTIMEVIFLVAVLLIRGPIGIGTVIVTFCSGFFVNKFYDMLKRGKEYE